MTKPTQAEQAAADTALLDRWLDVWERQGQSGAVIDTVSVRDGAPNAIWVALGRSALFHYLSVPNRLRVMSHTDPERFRAMNQMARASGGSSMDKAVADD